MKIVNSVIYPGENETLDELSYRTELNLIKFSMKHPDYSVVIDKHVDENYLVVKSIMMKEQVN